MRRWGRQEADEAPSWPARVAALDAWLASAAATSATAAAPAGGAAAREDPAGETLGGGLARRELRTALGSVLLAPSPEGAVCADGAEPAGAAAGGAGTGPHPASGPGNPTRGVTAALGERTPETRAGLAAGAPPGVTGRPGGEHTPGGMQSLVFAPPPIIRGDRHALHRRCCAAGGSDSVSWHRSDDDAAGRAAPALLGQAF